MLEVKLYEFRAENYYIKHLREIKNNISLDGIIATETMKFKFDDPPTVKTLKEIKFPRITNKERGLFILEFIGNGVASRALIKKGRLHLYEEMTIAGHKLMILDEEMNICRDVRTGIWLKKQFYPVNEEGVLIVPYGAVSE